MPGSPANISSASAATGWRCFLTRIVFARKSTGQRSSATRNPNPIVTAEVPYGSISSVSIDRVARPGRDAIVTDASPPITTAITAATTAYTSEFRSASHAGTNSVSVAPLDLCRI